MTSKNQIYRIESGDGLCIAKVFPQTPAGFDRAEREFTVGQALGKLEGVSVPEFLDLVDHVVVMKEILGISEANSVDTYRALLTFLQKTKDFILPVKVTEDWNNREEALLNLKKRQKNFGSDIIERLSRTPLELNPRESRFVLSDFSPLNVVASSGKFHFIDFESAGMGNPVRFACNLVLHPKSQLGRESFKDILEELNVSEAEVINAFPFSFAEWIFISRSPGHRMDFFHSEHGSEFYERFWTHRERLR